jgi:hypothetical protein
MKIRFVIVGLVAASGLLWSSTRALAFAGPTTSSAQTQPCPVASSTARCAAVPEGGTAPLYLVLATLVCGGAFFLRNREQVRD